MNKSKYAGLIGLIAVLCLVCSQPTQIEYGTLVIGIRWENISYGSSNAGTADSQRPEIHHRGLPAQITQKAVQSDELSKIRFTLQPGGLVFEFNTIQETYTIQAELGIYNLTVEVMNNAGKIVYTASYDEILIEPNKTKEVRLTMEPNFPAVAPTFVDLLPTHINNSGSYVLRWTSVLGAEFYTLHEDDDSTFASPTVSYSGPDTAHTVADKQEGKYYYRVNAGTSIGTSPWSASTAFQIIRVAVLSVKTVSLPTIIIGLTYTASLQAEGGTAPYTWSVSSGTLPTGLSLIASTGEISGTPTAAGTFGFTVQVKDNGSPQQSASKNLSITINPPELNVTTMSLVSGQVGTAYSRTVLAAGGTAPYTWSVSSGTLPTGLSLIASTGEISGTPTTAGTFGFMVQVKDSGIPQQSASKNLSITINPPELNVTTMSLVSGQVSTAYSRTVLAAGGTAPYTWSVSSGTLPTGLSLISSTGEISGTPTAAGTFDFTVQVKDSGTPQQSAAKNLSITIRPATLQVTTTSLPDGQAGQPYNQEVAATGGTTPYVWSISSGTLPGGLSINTSTGVISGTPAAAGTSNFTVQVADAAIPAHSDTRNLSITINPPTLQIATSSLAAGQVGQFYNQSVNATGGTAPYSWSISSGALPSELNINPSTGEISGTPPGAGTSAFVVRVTDSSIPQQTDSKALSITINPPPALQITTTALPDVTAGTSYSVLLNASGGTPPYNWSETGRNPIYLAEGINFSSGGTLSGTVYTQPESGQITLRVTDSGASPQTATKTYNLNIIPGNLELFSAYLPEGKVDEIYWGYITYRLGTSPLQSPWTITGSLPSNVITEYQADNYQMNISGAPGSSGTFSFSVTVRDSGSPQKTRTDSFTITINP